MCIHKCVGCTREQPLPRSQKEYNGKPFHESVPSCHPSAGFRAFVPGLPPEEEDISLKRVVPILPFNERHVSDHWLPPKRS